MYIVRGKNGRLKMKKVSMILLIIAYISLIAEGFICGISEGLLRLALCSLCFAIIIPFLPFLSLPNKDDKFDDKSDDAY